MEIDGQGDLFGGGGSIASPCPADESEEESDGAVDALVEALQGSLAFEDSKPDCKRSAEELSLPTWHHKSTRREDAEFEHAAEHAVELRAMNDNELAEAWGWVTKRRYRGLSERDQGVQREVYARCLGLLDLYGLGRQPAVSAMLEEVLRSQGCRSAVALYIVGLLELMLVRGRMALRMSAADAHVLKGCAASTWWAAVARLEALGIVQRVRTVKPGEHGPAPVQRSTNLYVLGPWWFEGDVPNATPLAQTLGLLAKCTRREESRAAQAAQRQTLSPRKARRRAANTRSRDRNRRRHRALPPRVTSTPEIVRVTEVLARERQAAEEAAVKQESFERGQALMRGDLEAASARLGDGAAPEVLSPPFEALEAAAVAEVEAVNQGRPRTGALRRELVRARPGSEAGQPASRPLVNCRPVSGRQSRRERPKEEFFSIRRSPPPPPAAQPTPPAHQHPPPKTAGDRSPRTSGFLGDRARALDEGERPGSPPWNEEPASMQADPIIQRAFLASFGYPMPLPEA